MNYKLITKQHKITIYIIYNKVRKKIISMNEVKIINNNNYNNKYNVINKGMN